VLTIVGYPTFLLCQSSDPYAIKKKQKVEHFIINDKLAAIVHL